MKRIWIGRSRRGAARWADAARAAGWQAEALPLIRTVPVAGEPASAARAGDLVALTSSAAVAHGLARFPKSLRRTLRFAVVGPATRAALRDVLPGAQVVADADGSGSHVLAEQLLAARKQSEDATVWWPCAAEPRPEMERAFGVAGVPLRTLVCYRTELRDGPVPPSGEAVLVFSPSGLAALAGRLDAVAWPPLLAVGATTAQAMRERGVEPLGVLDRLEPAALTELLGDLDLPASSGDPR